MRSTAGIPARKNGVWSSVIEYPVASGNIGPAPTAVAAERMRVHSDGDEFASRGSTSSRPAT
jgi:hypothetical protein